MNQPLEISDISIREHTCAVRCTNHYAYKDRLDLNRTAKYKYHMGRPQYIRITGEMLTQGPDAGQCKCVALFNLHDSTPLMRRLRAAKTKTSKTNAPRKSPKLETVMRRSLRNPIQFSE